MIVEDNKARKYVNYVETDRTENGTTKKLTGCNTFYFVENSLIKVEEIFISEHQVQQFEWYFQNDKCLYHSLQSDRADSRANLLLAMSKEFIKTLTKKAK